MNGSTTKQRIELAFNYARDEIQHSFDINGDVVTIKASDTLTKGVGICFAKAHLLVALLRGMRIPSGFCYQRVTRKGTKESGYALHGLCAVYLADEDKWLRIDPRGNRHGIYSEFNGECEVLAYTLKDELEEIDYPNIYTQPLASVIESMQTSIDCKELFYNRPEKIEL